MQLRNSLFFPISQYEYIWTRKYIYICIHEYLYATDADRDRQTERAEKRAVQANDLDTCPANWAKLELQEASSPPLPPRTRKIFKHTSPEWYIIYMYVRYMYSVKTIMRKYEKIRSSSSITITISPKFQKKYDTLCVNSINVNRINQWIWIKQTKTPFKTLPRHLVIYLFSLYYLYIFLAL